MSKIAPAQNTQSAYANEAPLTEQPLDRCGCSAAADPEEKKKKNSRSRSLQLNSFQRFFFSPQKGNWWGTNRSSRWPAASAAGFRCKIKIKNQKRRRKYSVSRNERRQQFLKYPNKKKIPWGTAASNRPRPSRNETFSSRCPSRERFLPLFFSSVLRTWNVRKFARFIRRTRGRGFDWIKFNQKKFETNCSSSSNVSCCFIAADCGLTFNVRNGREPPLIFSPI